MYCKSIRLINFRNVQKAEISFCEGVNVLEGKNAQGKTNLLEAIFYASVGRSFRGAHTAQIIRFGEDFADVSLDYADMEREKNIHMRIFKDKHRIVEKNGVRAEKLSDILGSFRAVLFCPEHLSLIKDGPAARRAYLDMALGRMYPLYIHALQNYNYALKQRNALIKQAFSDRATFEDTVELWNSQLAKEGAVISKMRYRYVQRAQKYVERFFSEMTSDAEAPKLVFDGGAGLDGDEYLDTELVKKRISELLSSSYEREISAGATLFGSHKDDIDITLNNKSSRLYASQGQQRSLALALKLAEGEICREEYGNYPVFLFDDVLSELDETRRDYLINRMKSKQVIISTCEAQTVQNFGSAKVIRVEDGKYFLP